MSIYSVAAVSLTARMCKREVRGKQSPGDTLVAPFWLGRFPLRKSFSSLSGWSDPWREATGTWEMLNLFWWSKSKHHWGSLAAVDCGCEALPMEILGWGSIPSENQTWLAGKSPHDMDVFSWKSLLFSMVNVSSRRLGSLNPCVPGPLVSDAGPIKHLRCTVLTPMMLGQNYQLWLVQLLRA